MGDAFPVIQSFLYNGASTRVYIKLVHFHRILLVYDTKWFPNANNPISALIQVVVLMGQISKGLATVTLVAECT
ncbi:hypothetical protein XELAEV_18015833mg [Xenopus laevis]|uniref:Uncharacterized protein n=1 Tax=Xenopus laevis TaxID=8355 RepID=A0A974DIS4_XENLA|nr:hypothetical protein XELAEV_18015833mg [Xenopus laevis]